MLQCKRGLMTVTGEMEEIKAEFASIVHSLRYNMSLSSDEILKIVYLGLLSEEELDDKISELDK